MIHFRPLSDFDNCHRGESIYVIGCGPSLWNWPPSTLRSKTRIFINTAVHYEDEMTKFEHVKAYRVIFDRASIFGYFKYPFHSDRPVKMPDVHTFQPIQAYENTNEMEQKIMEDTSWTLFNCAPLDPFRYGLQDNMLFYPSLFSAMSLAVRMGASRIHLVGVDYGPVDGVTHWDRQEDKVDMDDFNRSILSRMRVNMMPFCDINGVGLFRWHSPGVKMNLYQRTDLFERISNKRQA